MPRTPNDVKKLAKDAGVKIVDLRFIDLPGMWQHFSIPVEDLDDDLFSEGIGFDGSSIRGFQQIHESDMLLIADAETAVIDPVLSVPTMNIICNVFDPMSRKPYSRDPRYVAQKAEAYLKSTGIADISYWGPEAEFYIFDNVRYDQNAHSGYYYIDSGEGVWNTGRDENPNLGYKIRHKEGYFPVPPTDHAAGHSLGDHPRAQGYGHQGRGAPPRGGHRRPGRDRHALRPTDQDGRQPDELQVHHPHDLQEARHDGHLHAQAALWRQRLRHARAPEPVEGRHQRLLRQKGLRAAQPDREILHRRPAQARAGAACHLRPHH